MLGIYEILYERQLQKGIEPQYPDRLEVLARLGKNDEALALLRQLVDEYEFSVTWIGVSPYFDHLRGDPRFDELLLRAGLPKIAVPTRPSTP